MKLEGSLDAFSLPDIFQLLSFTKKTGGLHLAAEGSDGVVFFSDGQVTGASADSSRQPLARRLIGSGAVDDDALAAAVAAVNAGEGIGLVRALLDAGAVDAELLRRAAAEQTVDAVFDLTRWKAGDFAMVVDEPNPDDVGLTLAIDAVLAEAETRRATWETVSQVVPGPSTVLAMPVVLGTEPSVSREEWALLALVDGRRTVTELVDLTGSGQYAVVSTLAALVARGLLEVRGDAADAADHVAVVARRHRLLSSLEAFTPAAAPVGAPVATRPAGTEPVLAEAAVPVATAPTPPARDESAPESATGERATGEPATGEPATDSPALATASMSASPAEARSEAIESTPDMLGGAHVPGDVVPPRPEPFLPRRQAEFDEGTATPPVRAPSVPAGQPAPIGDVVGATVTSPDPDAPTAIERDPSINRSLMLRLIAGVRGL